MPQPISQFVRPGERFNLKFGPTVLDEKPELGAKIAQCISRWSYIDFNIEIMLIHILGAHSKPAHAMFSGVVNAPARGEMLYAAANSILEGRELELCNAILNFVSSQRKVRNKIAHNVWGACDIIHDGLLLAGPDQLTTTHLRMRDILNDVAAHKEPSDEALSSVLEQNYDKIFVYRAADFDGIIRDFSEVSSAIHYFTLSLISSEKQSDLYASWLHRVETLPSLASILSRSRVHRNNNQEALPPPP